MSKRNYSSKVSYGNLKLSDKHLVFPIWADSSIMPAGARGVLRGKEFSQTTPFPSPSVLTSLKKRDTTVDKELGVVPGGICGLIEGRLFVCGAQQLKEKAEHLDEDTLMLRMRAHGEETQVLEWAREHFMAEDDQIFGFIKAVNKMMYEELPEHNISYGRAHAWGPVVSENSTCSELVN